MRTAGWLLAWLLLALAVLAFLMDQTNDPQPVQPEPYVTETSQ